MPTVVLYNFPSMPGRFGMLIRNPIDEIIDMADEEGNVDAAGLSLEWGCLDCRYRTFVHENALQHSICQSIYHTRWQRVVRWVRIHFTWR